VIHHPAPAAPPHAAHLPQHHQQLQVII
jgi:hypothetical protein